MTITGWKTISATCFQELDAQVLELLMEGWQPYGDVYAYRDYLAIVMVKVIGHGEDKWRYPAPRGPYKKKGDPKCSK